MINEENQIIKTCYTAVDLTNHVQIGYDDIRIVRKDNNYLIEGRHTIYGQMALVQKSVFMVDKLWNPIQLHVDIISGPKGNLHVDFNDNEVLFNSTINGNNQSIKLHIKREDALFFLNGAFYFPLFITHRIRIENTQTRHFSLIPSGICQVTDVKEEKLDGQTMKIITAKLIVEDFEDFLQIYVNENGDMVKYITRNVNILVQLEK